MPGSSAFKLKLARLVVLEGLDQLLAGAHHERPVLRHRLLQRPTRHENGPTDPCIPRRLAPLELHGVTVGQYRELVSAYRRRGLSCAHAHRTFVDVEERRMAAREGLREPRARLQLHIEVR